MATKKGKNTEIDMDKKDIKKKASADIIAQDSDKSSNSDKSEEKEVKETKKRANPNCKWYVLNVRPGYENSVHNSLRQRIDATGMEDLISDILVPVQKKIVVKGGKQSIKEEKIFPGYVLVKMVLDENTWTIITGTDGIRGFVKTDKYPRPLPEREVLAIMKFMEVEQPAYQASFSVGEAVKIIDGAFADFIGSVESIDDSKGKVKVMISFLGREAPVELDFSQVSKL